MIACESKANLPVFWLMSILEGRRGGMMDIADTNRTISKRSKVTIWETLLTSLAAMKHVHQVQN